MTKRLTQQTFWQILCLILFTAGLQMHADTRTTSFNTAVDVLPAPGAVTIDGKDDDWDLSAGVWSYNDPTITDRYSVWTHLMWDEKGVYFLARYHDTSPMQNAAAGKDYQQSWRADCYQARVIFDDRDEAEHQMHVNMYYSTPDQRPYMIIHHGGFKSKPPYDQTGPKRDDQLERYGSTMEAAGGSIVARPWDDGKGYNLEAFWPWSYCRTSGTPLTPGEQFTFGIEAMWGNADGTLLAHRLADGIKDDRVNRIFMFRARDGWGKAVIRATGNLDVTEAQQALHKARLKQFVDYDTYGSVTIPYTLPGDRDVTIAIDDATGKRVRNLFGQYPREAGEVVDTWDCLDDAGNPVAPGTYTATIVHHEPVGLTLDNSVYSSATPPWPTEAGTKLWGANHGHPTGAATRGEFTVLSFTGTEGGSGLQRITDDGIIVWADNNEFLDAALDDTYAYGLSKSSWQKKTLLFRFRLTDGHLTPFDDADRSPSPALLPHADIPNGSSLAFAHGQLWACVLDHGLQRIDPATGAVLETRPLGDVIAVTDLADQLYTLAKTGAVSRVDADGKATVVFTAAGLKSPVRLSVSQDGKRYAISDAGTNQVHVYDAAGKQIGSIGSAYSGKERPAGAFVKTDLIQPWGTAFDHLGRLWIAEAVKSCKRVTDWTPELTLIDQYWGQADYGAMSGFPLDFDATRFVAHGIEFRLDPDPQPRVRKTNEEPLAFHPALVHARGFIVRHQGREYALGAPGFNKMDSLSIFMRNSDGVFVEVVRIDLAGRHMVDNKWVNRDGRAWTDLNLNGARDEGEESPVDAKGIYWSNGWIRPDLTILTTNGNIFAPKQFTDSGVPIYDFAAPTKPKNWISVKNAQGSAGTPLMDMAGNISDGINYHTVDGRTGSYPNPYGRHDAPAAQRGLLIAPFRTNGVVDGVPGVGSVVALGGDRGEWFLLSMDGLYISNICQDAKGNVTLDETFIGQESFGGFMWRNTQTGQVYVQLGGPSYRIMQVTGLETIVKETRTLTIGQDDIIASAKIIAERQQQSSTEPDSLRIAKIRSLPTEAAAVMSPGSRPIIDGAVEVRVSERGNQQRWFRAAMAHDGKELAIMYQVADPSPWKNAQGSFTHAFIGGDSVDLQLDVPGRGPIRILAAPVGGKPTVVYWQSKAETTLNPTTYVVENNPANATTFDVVKRLDDATVSVATGFNAYTVLVRIPLADLGLKPGMGDITGQIGVIYSDPSGSNRAARLYWHNKKTGLVSDVPTEARLTPDLWGTITID